jgi:UDP-N-acetylmuramyl pentapeptide phosphotransferase/UDP-N-acetylglucosamine-1-phosphate transferase
MGLGDFIPVVILLSQRFQTMNLTDGIDGLAAVPAILS